MYIVLYQPIKAIQNNFLYVIPKQEISDVINYRIVYHSQQEGQLGQKFG